MRAFKGHLWIFIRFTSSCDGCIAVERMTTTADDDDDSNAGNVDIHEKKKNAKKMPKSTVGLRVTWFVCQSPHSSAARTCSFSFRALADD